MLSAKLYNVGKKNPEFKYFMGGRELQCIKVETDLGVYVNKDLKFEQHINDCQKANRIAGMITQYIQYSTTV